MRKFLVLSIMVLLLAGINGCGIVDDLIPGEVGTVEGYIFAPDGKTAIVGVNVTVENTDLATTTNQEGYYQLTEVPTGNQNIIAFKGAFRIEFTVTVTEGTTVNAGDKNLVATGKIGVNAGSFDDIASILDDLGIEYEFFTGALLDNPGELSEFAILFFECGGLSIGEGTTRADNLKAFIANGGVIYASDYALDVPAAVFPDKVDLLGKVGSGVSGVQGTVLNSDLIAVLGKNTVTLDYTDSPGWNVIDTVAADVNIDITGDIQTYGDTVKDSPLLVHFYHGDGLAILTTFHNAAQATDDMLKILEQMAFGL